MKRVLFSLLGLVLANSVANGAVPDPANCTVVPGDALNGLFLAPEDFTGPIPGTTYIVSVRDAEGNAVSGSAVSFEFAGPIIQCGSAVLSGTTDANGEVEITLSGGGCAHNVPLSGLVKADGVTIRAYENVKSPDYDGASGDLGVTLADLIQFSIEFAAVSPNECHDYNNDGATDLGDLIMFAPPFLNATSCGP